MSSSSSSNSALIKTAGILAGGAAAVLGAYFLGSKAAEERQKATRDKNEALQAKHDDVALSIGHSRAVLPGAGDKETVFYPIEHIKDSWGADLETFESPLVTREWPRNKNFVSTGEYVLGSQPFVLEPGSAVVDEAEKIARHQVLHHHRGHSAASIEAAGREGGLAVSQCEGAVPATPSATPSAAGAGAPCSTLAKLPVAFAAAGPRPILYHDPKRTQIAIATCGGLCPGLNTVIREIVMAATYVYGVPTGNIFGVKGGYAGFYQGDDDHQEHWIPLTPDKVSRLHTVGGTFLGSSRGGMEPDRILDAIVARGINMVILIGGDGTHRGVALLTEHAKKRGLRVAIAAVTKSVDNDVPIIDRTFGFLTAVDEALAPLAAGHTEALAATNGIGVVQLMGRSAGFIALYASLASRDVNVCLIPEAPWKLSKVCEFLEERLAKRGHALVVVAEGAESEERKAEKEAAKAKAKAEGKEVEVARDPSGNPILEDVGEYLKAGILGHFKRKGVVCNLKLINPSYIIRAAPARASDSDLCSGLAFNAVHGLFAGHTSFTVGTVDNNAVWLPVDLIASSPPRRIDITSRIYARLISSTGQPSFT